MSVKSVGTNSGLSVFSVNMKPMKVPFLIQSTTDVDWFAIDINGYIGHFSSFGGRLPTNLPDTIEEIDSLADYLLSFPFTCFEIIPNPHIEAHVQFQRRIDRKLYFEDFDEIVMRGLFAFGKADVINLNDYRYHLAASPENPLSVNDLPDEIAAALRKMKMEIDFRTSFSIDISKYIDNGSSYM